MVSLWQLLRVKHYRWPLYIALVIGGTTTWGEFDIATAYSVNIELHGNGKEVLTKTDASTINSVVIQGSAMLSTLITILTIDLWES